MLQRKLFNFFLTFVVLTYIIFEELVWERFARPIINYINSLKILKRLEAYLQGVNSKVILVLFLVLFVIVEFQGLYAGVLFVEGKVLTGVILYASKIPIAAFTFWLFRVTKDKLMAFAWFAKSYRWMMHLIEKIKASEVYLNIKKRTIMIKASLGEVRSTLFKEKSLIKRKIQVIYRKLKDVLRA